MALFAPDTAFQPILTHFQSALNNKKNLLLCSGKFLYEILRLAESDPQFALDNCVVSVEELLPFPEE